MRIELFNFCHILCTPTRQNPKQEQLPKKLVCLPERTTVPPRRHRRRRRPPPPVCPILLLCSSTLPLLSPFHPFSIFHHLSFFILLPLSPPIPPPLSLSISLSFISFILSLHFSSLLIPFTSSILFFIFPYPFPSESSSSSFLVVHSCTTPTPAKLVADIENTFMKNIYFLIVLTFLISNRYLKLLFFIM